MRTHKTKTGTGIEQTYGMRDSHPSVLWVVVATNSELRVFSKAKKNEPLDLVQEEAHSEGRLGGHELVSDRPGRAFQNHTQSHSGHQTGPLRHALTGEKDPKEQASDDWARKIAGILETGLERNRYEHLILVAEPRLAGRLHGHLTAEIRKRVSATYEKDFGGWISESSLLERLEALMSGGG
jgi:protein required for attachment to host cells